MSSQIQPLLQKLIINNIEINPLLVVSFTYMEAMDLSAPAIILKLYDEQGGIRDEVGLKKDTIIECELASSIDETVSTFTERFIVSAYPVANAVITVEALQENCHRLKIPTSSPVFFVDKTPQQIIEALLPELSVNSTVRNSTGTYHLNTGVSPSKLLRQMARDFGASCWICRGTVHFHPLKGLDRQQVYLKFGVLSNSADILIVGHKVINNQSHYERLMHKKWLSQSLDRGLISSESHTSKEMVMLPNMPKWKLENQSLFLQPRLDIETVGMGDLVPSTLVEVESVKVSFNGEIDESIESKMVVQRVSHHEYKQHYTMRAILGVVNRGE